MCLDRLSEWDGEDAPARVLMFAGDIPRRDQPLPRFIDDAAAAKLLRAAREHPDPFTRLAVEFLARTGLRKSEFLDLTVDSVVQIGAAYWLHVPLGKLRTDRYIPLHPQLKEMLDEWVAERPAGLREPYLFIERGRRIGKQRVGDAVANAAQAAGIGRVTPHQLRHTLATQAINRGMSLEAIAALLGHKSMRMTMVYAKIANRTVADEYFSVSEKVEALYDAPKGTTRHRRGRRDAQAPRRDAPADARQRLLRPPRRPGLPLRIDLRIVHLLPDHARIPPHAPAPARRRRREGAGRPLEDLRRPPRQTRATGIMTALMTEPVLFEVATNPEPDSTLPFLIRLPLATGELVLKARDSWPRTAKVYCHRADRWPEEPQIIERVPIRSCQRRGVAIDLVLDRPRENRSQLIFTRIQGGREGIFWQTARTTRQARPGIRVPRRLAAGLTELTILIDSRERYPYKFAQQQATTERQALPAGDFAIAHDDKIVAVVERKSLADFVRRLIDGQLTYALADLATIPRAAVVIEDRYSNLFKLEYTQPGFVTEMLAALTVRYPAVPIHFAETRPLAEEWTYRFLGAALAYHQADRT